MMQLKKRELQLESYIAVGGVDTTDGYAASWFGIAMDIEV